MASGPGIYLRNVVSTSAPTDFAVNFTPQVHRDADVRGEKLAVEEQLGLVSTVDWVMAPKSLLLPHNGRCVAVLFFGKFWDIFEPTSFASLLLVLLHVLSIQTGPVIVLVGFRTYTY